MKSQLKLFLFFFSVVFILYFPTRNAGFVTDFIGWQWSFNKQTFWQILQGEEHGIKSFYQFTHLLMFAMSRLFGMWGLPWLVVQSIMVAFAALSVYQLYLRMCRVFNFKNAENIGIIAVLSCLLSPYLAEVMVWRAAFHYPLAFAIHIGYVHLALSYYEQRRFQFVLWANVLFIISLMSLEYFFVTPFLVTATFILISLNDRTVLIKNKKILIKTVLAFIVTPLSCIALYMFLYTAKYGKIVAHGREDAFGLLFKPESYANFGKYTSKYLLFARHWLHPIKEQFFNFFSKPSIELILMCSVIGIGILGLLFWHRFKPKVKMIFWSYTFFVLWMVPIMSLYFAYILLTENDRYGFIPSVFLFLCVVLILSSLPKKIFYGISIVYLSISCFLTIKTNRQWKEASDVYWNLINTFKWSDAEEIILLNVPDCFNGMYMFRTYDSNSAFAEAIDVYRGKNIASKTIEVFRYNMNEKKDGVRVRIDGPNKLAVIFNQFGS